MQIRKYKPSDKPRMRYICRETANEGFKKSFAKLDSIPVMFNDYYTENEPENIFILADDSDIAVGYIICSTDIKKFYKLNLTYYAKRVMSICPSSLPVLFAAPVLMKTVKHTPVHFHIDILPGYQKGGWGTRLINSLCNELKSKDVKYLYAFGINRNSIGYKFYKKLGFYECANYGLDTVSIVKEL